jgi:pimeloyl-ACP methyl ester carboxylesterase
MKYLKIILILIAASAMGQEKLLAPTDINMENIGYPFPVKYLKLSIQDQEFNMAYMDLVPKESNGHTIVLLHGKNFSGMYWEQTAKDLAKAGYRVIMPDQIGFGKSSKTTNMQYSFQLLAQNTKALLDYLKIEKAAVLGHSMGGMLAVRFALMYPKFTEKLILENPIGLEDWKKAVPYQSVDDWYESESGQTYEKMKTYQKESYYGGQWKPEYDRWLIPQAGWTLNKNYRVIAKNSALIYDMIFTQPVVYEFENIKVPTLLIIGQRDRTALGKDRAPKEFQQKLGNYPELGKAAAKRISKAELVELDNVGHLPHVEAYDEFIAPLLQFLKK